MLTKSNICRAMLLGCALAIPAWAQQNPTTDSTPPASAYPPPPYYGYGGIYGGGGGFTGEYFGAGTTPAGSYMAGMGQAIRAAGQYNLYTSEAAVNLEEAERRDILNQELWTNTYFELRKINQKYQADQRGPRGTPETWARLAHDSAPKRLSPGSIDAVTGRINWPSLLTEPQFRAEREKLDQMFARRAAQSGAIGASGYASIKKSVDTMLEQLKQQVREVDSRYYLEARTFLTGLLREAEFTARPAPQFSNS